MNSLSEQEINTLTELLKKLEPGELPRDVFFQIARIYTSSIIEIVPFVRKDGETKVLLTERGKDDPIWGGKVHTPGTVLRATDSDGNFKDAFSRIINKELNSPEIITGPIFVDKVFRQVARGKELALIYWIEIKDNKNLGDEKLFNINNLPENIVDTQPELIKVAYENFKKFTNKKL